MAESQIQGSVGWMVTDTDTNAASTATKAAVAGEQHYVVGMSGGYDNAAVGKLMQLKDDTTVICNVLTPKDGPAVFNFSKPVAITEGKLCSVTIAAGGSSIVGACAIWGFTV